MCNGGDREVEKKNKIGQSFYLMMFAIFPFIFPSGLLSIPFLSHISKLKYLSIIIVCLYTIRNGKLKINKLTQMLLLFSVELFLVTFIRDGYIDQAIKLVIEIFVPLLWANYMLKRYKESTLKILSYYFTIVAFINFVMQVLMPQGLGSGTQIINVLGEDNKMAIVLLPSFAICLAYFSKYGKKKHSALKITLLAAVYLSSLVYVWAVTGMVVLVLVLLIWFLMERNKEWRRILNLRNGLILVVLLAYVIIFNNDIFSKGIIGDFIVNVLGKTVTFSGRITLWQQAIELIKESPLLGYGISSVSERALLFHTANGILNGFSAHNGYLLILLRGGIVGLAIYILALLKLIKPVRQVWKKSSEARILSLALLGFLIVCIFEAEFYCCQFLIMIIYIYNLKPEDRYRSLNENIS